MLPGASPIRRCSLCRQTSNLWKVRGRSSIARSNKQMSQRQRNPSSFWKGLQVDRLHFETLIVTHDETMPAKVELYDSAYANYQLALYRQIRLETYGEDLGQTSWVTTEES